MMRAEANASELADCVRLPALFSASVDWAGTAEHIGTQEVCLQSILSGPHLLTLQMADLKSDSHLVRDGRRGSDGGRGRARGGDSRTERSQERGRPLTKP